MSEYEINENTLAVISLENGGCRVLERDAQYDFSCRAYQVMDNSCQYFGSSYEGRVAGARKLLNANYKLPIIVEESRQIIFFPTESPSLNSCIWLSLNEIERIDSKLGQAIIVFKNGFKLPLMTSYASINNQMLRASKLAYLLNARKMKKNL